MIKPFVWIAVLVLTGTLLFGCMSGMQVPANLDLATTHMTDKGLYKVTMKPDVEPIAINAIHTWTLHVETPDGKPVEGAVIKVDGDMPQHGHGLPTKPQVTEYLGEGNYRVDGMKFQMTGWWVIEFDVESSGQTDHVKFNLVLS